MRRGAVFDVSARFDPWQIAPRLAARVGRGSAPAGQARRDCVLRENPTPLGLRFRYGRPDRAALCAADSDRGDIDMGAACDAIPVRPSRSPRPASTAARPVAAAEPKLACRGVWKLYRRRAPRASSPAAARRPRPRRSQAAGLTPAVIDADLDIARRRVLRDHGAVGLGQVDAGALPVAADRADRRRDRLRGARPARDVRARADRAAPAPHGHGVPALRAAAAPERARQRRVSARDPGRRAARARGAGARDDRAGRAQGPRGAPAAPAVGRPAAAGRHRALAGGRARSCGSSTSRSRRSTR